MVVRQLNKNLHLFFTDLGLSIALLLFSSVCFKHRMPKDLVRICLRLNDSKQANSFIWVYLVLFGCTTLQG